MAVPVNSDLPSSWLVPGIYIQLNLSGGGASLNSPLKRLLLVGYKSSSGTKPQDSPVQTLQQSDANTWFGQGSDLARLYAAAVSQYGQGLCDIYCLPIAEPAAGTAATHLIAFAGTATSPGSVDIWICGYKVSVAIASGDTATAIGGNVATAINAVGDLPVTASNGSGTVTLTYKTKGLTGNDLPRIVNLNGAAGITASPGTIALSGTASGSGSATLSVGATTFSASVANLDTAATVGGNLVTAINATPGPVTASGTSTVTLFYVRDRVVHRIAATMPSGLSATPAVGTAGAGAPTLTNALTNMAGQTAFKVWCTSLTDSASLGSMATHIELYANGLYQKDQTLYFGSTDSLTVAGAIPSGTSPALTTSPRYSEVWCQDSPQQAWELAARAAVMVCVEDYAPRNYDGKALTTSGTVPLLMPAPASRPDPGTANSAMYSYHITPLVTDASGALRVLRGMTTSTSADQRQWDWSFPQTLGYYRYDLGVFLQSRFSGKSLKATGIPRTSNTVTPTSIQDAAYERLRQWDFADLFDDVESVKNAIKANVDALVPSKVDLFVPLKPPINLHQIGVVGGT